MSDGSGSGNAGTTPQETPQEKRSDTYHHGDLRTALVLAAREALNASPAEPITIKSLASRLGVSQPALYRHFDDRDALLAAVAADGFDRLRSALTAVRDSEPGEMALERLCRSYIAFGTENAGVYRLMFSRRSLVAKDGNPLSGAADACFEILSDHVRRRVGSSQATMRALSTWATLHGLVTLETEGLLFGPQGGRDVTSREIINGIAAGLTRSHEP